MAWFILTKENKIIAKCNYRPDAVDLASREEYTIEGANEIKLVRAKLIHGCIVDVPREFKVDQKQKEYKLVYHRMFVNVLEELKKEGKIEALKDYK